MKSVTLTTCFSGKTPLLDEFMAQIENIINEGVARLNYCVLDNSHDKAFSDKLVYLLDGLGIPYQYRTLDDPNMTIEKVGYGQEMTQPMHKICNILFNEMAPQESDFIWNLEDDVVVYSDSPLETFLNAMESRQDYGTIIGLVYGRRGDARGYCFPQAWFFKRIQVVPNGVVKYVMAGREPYEPEGFLQVATGAHSCWFTRRHLLNEYPIRSEVGRWGPDIYWGHSLMEDGKWKFGADFSVKCKHYEWVRHNQTYKEISLETFQQAQLKTKTEPVVYPSGFMSGVRKK